MEPEVHVLEVVRAVLLVISGTSMFCVGLGLKQVAARQAKEAARKKKLRELRPQ